MWRLTYLTGGTQHTHVSMRSSTSMPKNRFEFIIRKRSQILFIGPESDHWECLSLTDSLTHSLTNSLLFSKLDWCNPGMWRWQLKLVEVVTVAHVDDKKRVDNSLVQIWKVKFGLKVKFLFRLWVQGFKVWSRFWSWCSGKILKLKFGHYFATDTWGVVMKLNLGWDSEARFGQDF